MGAGWAEKRLKSETQFNSYERAFSAGTAERQQGQARNASVPAHVMFCCMLQWKSGSQSDDSWTAVESASFAPWVLYPLRLRGAEQRDISGSRGRSGPNISRLALDCPQESGGTARPCEHWVAAILDVLREARNSDRTRNEVCHLVLVCLCG